MFAGIYLFEVVGVADYGICLWEIWGRRGVFAEASKLLLLRFRSLGEFFDVIPVVELADSRVGFRAYWSHNFVVNFFKDVHRA